MITKEQAREALCDDPNCCTTECKLARAIIALHERVERLTEALLPFAREADAWPDDWPNSADNIEAIAIYLTKGDFVAARAILKETTHD